MIKKIYKIQINILVIILIGLILTQIITSYVFSFIVEKQLNLQFNKIIKSSLIKVKHRTYNRGVFSSEASTEIVLNSNLLSTIIKLFPNIDLKTKNAIANNEYSIKYTTHIEHGLFIGVFHGYFYPTLAYTTDSIIYSNKTKELLSKFFNNEVPLNIVNIIYFNKSGKYYINSSSFSYMEAVSEIKVDWKGLNTQINYDQNFDKLQMNLHIPYLSISAPTKGSFILDNLLYTSNTITSNNDINTGLTILTIDKIQAEWKDGIFINLKLGNLISLLTGLKSTEFLNGLDTINPNQFMFNDIKYMTSSSDINNYFNANSDISFQSLLTNKKKYGPLKFNISIEHIYSPAYSNIIDTLFNQSTPVINKEHFLNNMKKGFYPLLKKQPLIKLNAFNLILPSGKIDINGYITIKNMQDKDIYDVNSFMTKLEYKLNISSPKDIFNELFIFQMKYLLSSGNTHMDQQSSNALIKVANILLDNQINTWRKKGFIVVKDNIISTKMSNLNGKFKISGN